MTKPDQLLVDIVQFDDQLHKDFVFDSWIQTYRRFAHSLYCDGETYHKMMSNRLWRYIDDSNINILVAIDPEDPDYFYGWLATIELEDEPYILYTFVKKPFRNQKIALQLAGYAGLTKYPIKCFYWTDYATKVAKKSIKLKRMNLL